MSSGDPGSLEAWVSPPSRQSEQPIGVLLIRLYSGATMAKRISLLMDGGDDPDRRREAAEVAREVNVAISELEHRLDAFRTSAYPVGFFCECGCMGLAPTTMADFRKSGGAWIEGHDPRQPEVEAARLI